MGVTRYRTFEEAEQALWNFAPDAAYYEQVRAMFDLAERLRDHSFKPGLTKFRSIADKDRAVSLHDQ
ncbi:MAG: hypothetical protein WCP20_07795 [Desulfuromonadales bacterium]